jgi:hypothetical protein
MSLEFKFWVAHIIAFRQFIAATESLWPIAASDALWYGVQRNLDNRPARPHAIVDDRPREDADEIGKIDDAAAKAEVAAMPAAVYGKDKI